MNVYLTKQEDGNTEACDMLIKFLDLDDDSFEYISYDTWLPSDAVSDNTILDKKGRESMAILCLVCDTL